MKRILGILFIMGLSQARANPPEEHLENFFGGAYSDTDPGSLLDRSCRDRLKVVFQAYREKTTEERKAAEARGERPEKILESYLFPPSVPGKHPSKVRDQRRKVFMGQVAALVMARRNELNSEATGNQSHQRTVDRMTTALSYTLAVEALKIYVMQGESIDYGERDRMGLLLIGIKNAPASCLYELQNLGPKF